MSKQHVTIIQKSGFERQITIEIDADDRESAIEALQCGEIDIPAADDPNWTTTWTLQSEDYE